MSTCHDRWWLYGAKDLDVTLKSTLHIYRQHEIFWQVSSLIKNIKQQIFEISFCHDDNALKAMMFCDKSLKSSIKEQILRYLRCDIWMELEAPTATWSADVQMEHKFKLQTLFRCIMSSHVLITRLYFWTHTIFFTLLFCLWWTIFWFTQTTSIYVFVQ